MQLEKNSNKVINKVSEYIKEANLTSVMESCRLLVEKNTGRKMKKFTGLSKLKKIKLNEEEDCVNVIDSDLEDKELVEEIKGKAIKKSKKAMRKVKNRGGRKKRSKSVRVRQSKLGRKRRRGDMKLRSSSIARSFVSKGEVFRMNLTTF